MNLTAIVKLNLFFTALIWLAPARAALLPSGSELEIRLLNRVGSRISRAGDVVQATIITPVFDHDAILVPAGATVSGVIEHLDRLGLGLRHTAARLDLRFTQLHLPDETVVPIEARLSSVEEAREIVNRSGVVIGIHPSASLSTGVSGIFTLFFIGEPEFRLPVLAFKLLAARSPDAEITFPAGTEMLLRLTRTVELHHSRFNGPTVTPLTMPEGNHLQRMLAMLPQQQTERDHKHSSDLINIVLLGSGQAIERAFRAAGWNGSEPHGVMALYHMYHCVAQRVGYSMAPMTNLELNGSLPDATFQKSLNTLAKRHHIRLWHEEQSDLWLGAATEDVKYKLRKLGITHDTDRDIDNERAKVVNDLVFTGCIDRGALVPRASLKTVQGSARSILTDGDVAVLQFNSCDDPHLMPSDPQRRRPVRGVRAAIGVSEDILRSNPVSVVYAMTKSMFDSSESREQDRAQRTGKYVRAISISNFGEATASGSLALR